MIKYTTKDIINRASQLADLQNSDFISWNENINLLNENWQKIYQQLIDNGDKTFIKEFETVASNKIKLPCDFYQLFAVELVPSCRQVLRKAKSESEFSLTYDIENDYLILYGTVSEKVRIKYLPTPQTLTLQNVTKDINADFNTIYSNLSSNESVKFLDCYKNKYVYIKKSVGTPTTWNIFIYNKDTNEDYFVGSETTEITNAILGAKNNIYYTTYSEDNVAYNIYSKSKNNNNTTTIEVDSESSACLLKRDKDIGAVVVKGSVIKIYVNDKMYEYDISERINTDVIDNIVLDGKGIATFKSITDNYITLLLPTFDGDKNKWIQLDIDNTVNLSVNETIPFEGLDFGNRNTYKRYSNIVDRKVCISTKDMFYVDGFGLFYNDEYEVIGVNELNNDNGYGISIFDTYDTEHILLHSCFVDTVLLYPNNVYFNFMAMLLAISYKIKQNADVTILSAKYGEMEAQYFDSLSRDVNNVVRITNVY
jgi:hypothetical protein